MYWMTWDTAFMREALVIDLFPEITTIFRFKDTTIAGIQDHHEIIVGIKSYFLQAPSYRKLDRHPEDVKGCDWFF